MHVVSRKMILLHNFFKKCFLLTCNSCHILHEQIWLFGSCHNKFPYLNVGWLCNDKRKYIQRVNNYILVWVTQDSVSLHRVSVCSLHEENLFGWKLKVVLINFSFITSEELWIYYQTWDISLEQKCILLRGKLCY